jgi:ABC-type Co2+ transport system permease subunit
VAQRTNLLTPLGRIGHSLLPLTTAPRGSQRDQRLQVRAGLAVVVALVSGLAALTIVLIGLAAEWAEGRLSLLTSAAAALLALVSVFAPPVTFRTRSATLTEEVLSDPLSRPRPWRSTTITFEPVLVGAMIAGLSFGPWLAGTTFGIALVARAVLNGRHRHREDVNAAFHALRRSWNSAVVAAAAYAVVYSLRDSVMMNISPWTLLLAAFIAASVTLMLNAIERWVDGVHEPWAFARDFIDSRRLIVMVVSALIAWVSAYTISFGTLIEPRSAEFAGQIAATGVFLACWLILLFASIRLWRRDALRTLGRWSRHQTDILGRIADGSLDPDLARQASLAVTSRMALSVFGATRALVAVHRADGSVVRQLAVADVHAQPATSDYHDLTDLASIRIPLYPAPGHRDSSDITVAGFLGPARFVARSLGVTERFQQLATAAILTPVVASDEDRLTTAFESLFDRNLWHTMESFERAFEEMRQRADDSPQSHSVLIGVLAIDDFGALSGGRFEHAAIAQVIRLVQGYSGFTGHETFISYQPDGRIWVCFGSGPLIRNGVGLLRELQRDINDRGSVLATHSDMGVHIGVSLGYSVHQVDDFSYDGLIEHASQRLLIDQSARNPFAIDDVLTLDITPEAITGSGTPAVAVDITARLREDIDSDLDERFPVTLQPILDPNGRLAAAMAGVGWDGSPTRSGTMESEEFLSLVNRRPELAAEATRAILHRLKPVFADLIEANVTGDGAEQRILVPLPSVLLHPDIGVLALPNLVSPFLNRVECARLVAVFDTVPTGGGQALRLLGDRGVGIAMTAGAAATADGSDLDGWQRWAVLLPERVFAGDSGIDRLTIQQTVAAIATRDTRLIAETSRPTSTESLADYGIRLVLHHELQAANLPDLLQEIPSEPVLP